MFPSYVVVCETTNFGGSFAVIISFVSGLVTLSSMRGKPYFFRPLVSRPLATYSTTTLSTSYDAIQAGSEDFSVATTGLAATSIAAAGFQPLAS